MLLSLLISLNGTCHQHIYVVTALFIYCSFPLATLLECQLQKDMGFACLGHCCIPDAWYIVGAQHLLVE